MRQSALLVLVGALCLFGTHLARGQKPKVERPEPASVHAMEDMKCFARLVSVYELTVLHVKELEVDPIREALDAMCRDLRAEGKLEASWSAKSLPVKPKAADLSEFEARAIRALDAGASEVLEMPSSNTILYLRPVRAERSCVAVCHAVRPLANASIADVTKPERPLLKPGDVLGAMSLRITLEPRKP